MGQYKGHGKENRYQARRKGRRTSWLISETGDPFAEAPKAWRGVPGWVSTRNSKSHGTSHYAPVSTRDRLVLTRGEQVQPAPPERVEEMIRRAEALGLHDHSGYWSVATDALFEGVTLFEEEMSR